MNKRTKKVMNLIMAGIFLFSGTYVLFTAHNDPVMLELGGLDIGVAYLIGMLDD
jgi:hypothetical protein